MTQPGEEKPEHSEVDEFMVHFKLLKRRNPPADLSSVIDLDKPENFCAVRRHKLESSKYEIMDGLDNPCNWKIYELSKVPGAFVIRNPFFKWLRNYLVARCLVSYPKKPNVTNLDTESGRAYDDIWSAAMHPNADPKAKKFLQQLRWTTIGCHYDWTKKVYVREKLFEFPPDLAKISQYIIEVVLGLTTRFKAEAGIVNYYHKDSSLSGHTDHSEFDLTAPLVSISFGLPCVFMIGGKTKFQVPEAVFLQDGDVVIMSNDARMSYHAVPRILTYDYFLKSNISAEKHKQLVIQDMISEQKPEEHTGKDLLRVSDDICESAAKRPRIMPDDADILDSSVISLLKTAEFCSSVSSFMRDTRININIRQLFEPGKSAGDYIWPDVDTWKPPKS